jgi:hypothetical protein
MPHVLTVMAMEMVGTPAYMQSASSCKAAKPAPSAREGAPAVTVTLRDYDFVFSTPLVAGTQTLRLVNEAAQHHEMFIAALVPGKKAVDFAQWAEKPAGPPPGMPLGGITGLNKGEWNDLTLTLEPGDYALICFLPDAGDGKPHLVHGMIKEFTVAPRVA